MVLGHRNPSDIYLPLQEAVRMRDQFRRLMALQEARATEGVAEV